MHDPDTIPAESYASTAGELRALARVLVRALGVVALYWTAVEKLPPTHPYRTAAGIVEAYLRRRYGV